MSREWGLSDAYLCDELLLTSRFPLLLTDTF